MKHNIGIHIIILIGAVLFPCKMVSASETRLDKLREPFIKLDFEDTLTASQGAENVKSIEGPVRKFENAVIGKGLKCGIEGASEYLLDKAAEWQEGTLCFWFKWMQPDNESFIFLLQLKSSDESLSMYIYPHRSYGFLALGRKGNMNTRRLHAISALTEKWKAAPEKWHFIAVSWSKSEGRLYMDGIMINANTEFAGTPLKFDKIIAGMQSVKYADEGRRKIDTNRNYLLDEIALYDKALSPEDICLIYESVSGAITDKDDF